MNDYFIHNKLRVFTTFSGYDSQCLALNRLKERFPGFDYELVGWSEIDKNAIKAHNLLFPEAKDLNYGDISTIDWAQVPDFELLTYSSPCFVAGTLVLTYAGLKPIEDVTEYDTVMTHNNRYNQVLEVKNRNYSGKLYCIKGTSCNNIYCTDEHPFYVRKRRYVGHISKRVFEKPEWIKAKDLTKDYFLGFSVDTSSELPKWNGSIDNRWGHHRPVNKLSSLFEYGDFWYIIGRYVGDGWTRSGKTTKGIIICCTEKDKQTLIEPIERIGLKYVETHERTAIRIFIIMKELMEFVERYGHGAGNKHVDGETLHLPVHLLKSFLDGYIDADGCLDKKQNEYTATTISRNLAYGIAQCVAKVYKTAPRIYFCKMKPTKIIEGRLVNQHDFWRIVFKIDVRKQDRSFYEDGIIWFQINNISYEEVENYKVYNLEVKDDNSYTANNAIVHNCQSFSLAGDMTGGEEGSGTKSSLLWEIRKCIEVKRPKFMILENVYTLVSKHHIDVFKRWIDTLDAYGYKSSYQILNSKNFGIPQNRDRVFLVSVYKDSDISKRKKFEFPTGSEDIPKLSDILDKEKPDESYYMPREKLIKWINENERRICEYISERNSIDIDAVKTSEDIDEQHFIHMPRKKKLTEEELELLAQQEAEEKIAQEEQAEFDSSFEVSQSNDSKKKKEVKPIIEYLTEEDKKRRGRDRCILRIPTPTCSDGSAPTIMATGYASADYKNFYSVGHFPKLAVFEIWHHEPSQEELDAENNALY